MSEESDFMELLQLQGTLDMVTKSDMLEWAKGEDLPVTQRQLTSLMADRLLPKTARIGSRGGAFPKITEEQLRFVLRCRSRGMSVAAVRELIPVWRYMVGAVARSELSISELERVANESISTPEAVYALPRVVTSALPCAHCQSDELSAMKFVMKDETRKSRGSGDMVSIGFATIAGDCHVQDFTRVAIPDADEEHQTSTVVLHVNLDEPSKVADPSTEEGDGVEKGDDT